MIIRIKNFAIPLDERFIFARADGNQIAVVLGEGTTANIDCKDEGEAEQCLNDIVKAMPSLLKIQNIVIPLDRRLLYAGFSPSAQRIIFYFEKGKMTTGIPVSDAEKVTEILDLFVEKKAVPSIVKDKKKGK